MKSLINSILGIFDVTLARKSSYKELLSKINKLRDYELSEVIESKFLLEYFENLKLSKSQLRQDLFVLSELGFKREGFFVEFGATNGVDLSNSYLLETKFGWNGILAEPAKRWHGDLAQNRSVNIEKDCVWKMTGEKLRFNEVPDGEFSTLDKFSNSDRHKKSRKGGKKYEVNTISLNDLLTKYDAPKLIDYLSIDTEGSELDILKSFNFDNYKFKVITCEHNYTSAREGIYKLLTDNGYKRKFVEQSLWDDWYVINGSEL